MIDELHDRVSTLEGKFDDCKDDVSGQLSHMREELQALKDSVEQLISILTAGKGFFTVMGWIGKVILWMAAIAGAVWGLFHIGAK